MPPTSFLEIYMIHAIFKGGNSYQKSIQYLQAFTKKSETLIFVLDVAFK